MGGCAFASRLLGVGADSGDVGKAAKADDLETLISICEGKIAAESRKVQDYACEQRQTVAHRQAALTGECDTLAEAYEKNGASNAAYVEGMAKRFAECNDYETLFEDVVHWGSSSEGAEILAHLEEAGFDVNAGWTHYVETHQGMEFMANDNGLYIAYASAHIQQWLQDAGHDEHCVAIAGAASHSEWAAQAGFLPYLARTGCDEGVDIMVELLTSKNYGQRVKACETLADHGRAKDLEVLDIIAQTDPYMVLNEVTRDNRVYAVETWPVRTACVNAIGQIQIRSAQP